MILPPHFICPSELRVEAANVTASATTDKRRAWAVMVTVLLAGGVVAANRFKVPPLMADLMTDLQADMVIGGWFMSVTSLAVVVLSIPAAYILTRLGLKLTGLIALGCTLVGTVAGALSTNAATMLLGRTVEGIGGGLIGVVAPAAISAWFEPRERGLPMGIWAAWVPIGNVLMFNIAHPIRAPFGWPAVWWFGVLLVAAVFLLFAVVVTAPPQTASGMSDAPGSFGRRLLNPASWLLALAFGLFSFSLLSYNTWAPSFCVETLSVTAPRASFCASMMFLAAIPGTIMAGWALNRTQHRWRLLLAAFLLTGLLFAWAFRLGDESIIAPYMLTLGFVSNFIPTSIFTFAPETMDHPSFAGLGLAIVMTGAGTGTLVGPPVVGAIVTHAGWTWASLCLAVAIGFGTTAALLARISMVSQDGRHRL
jgi:MFS family permease